MKLVFTHPNSMIVGSMAGVLSQAGIESEFRNEFLGGAAGELAPGEAWMELWVTDDSLANWAGQLIKEAMEETQGPDWQCKGCQDTNPASFDTCWQCGKAKDEP